MKLVHRVTASLAVLAGVLAGLVTTAGPASASTCSPGRNAAGQSVYYCAVWAPTGGVPVYASTSTGTSVVGRLYKAGTANWFYCRQAGSTATGYGYSSSSWAKTKADNGAVGWVPAIYYAGAENYWPGVPNCTTAPTTQKIVSHTYYTQINGWYCGPAATQIALTSWGRNWSNQGFASYGAYQEHLARRLGTHSGGTDSIAQVTSVLNAITGTSYYQTTWIGGSYATATQKSAFRAALVNNVNQGRALVANVVGYAYDTNGRYLSYPGGHYLAVTGYSQSGALARVSDNASSWAGEYWMSTDKLADWIAGRGYSA